MVFVDPTVPDYQTLVAGMGPNVDVVVLDASRDGVEQIAESLAGRSGIDAIHLIRTVTQEHCNWAPAR